MDKTSCCSIDDKIDGCEGFPSFCEGFLAEKSPEMIFIGGSFKDDESFGHIMQIYRMCDFS